MTGTPRNGSMDRPREPAHRPRWRWGLACLLALMLAGRPAPRAEEPAAPPPLSVILMIGDGMGPGQVTLGQMFREAPLALDALPVTGLVKTVAANALVADSAATATALASGVKTNNGMVGVTPDGTPVKTLLETLQERGYATGLVTTSRLTHATPACFAAHVPNRGDEEAIAAQYAAGGVDLFLGGGARYLRTGAFPGHTLVRTRRELLAAAGPRLLGLFALDHLPYALDRGPHDPSLAEMTTQALRHLSARPFFLMVEGARIDHACHSYDAAGSIHELWDFDAAVAAAHRFVRESGRTLLVVTADHATGGLAITDAVTKRRDRFARVTASAHVLARQIVQAARHQEPEAAVRTVLAEQAGITTLSAADLDDLLAALRQRKEAPNRLRRRVGTVLSRWIGITFIPADRPDIRPYGHDGTMVPVYAAGPGAPRFTGTLDNTDIPALILQAVAAAARL